MRALRHHSAQRLRESGPDRDERLRDFERARSHVPNLQPYTVYGFITHRLATRTTHAHMAHACDMDMSRVERPDMRCLMLRGVAAYRVPPVGTAKP